MADRILPAIRCRLPEQSKARIQAVVRQPELALGLGSRKTLCPLGTELPTTLGLAVLLSTQLRLSTLQWWGMDGQEPDHKVFSPKIYPHPFRLPLGRTVEVIHKGQGWWALQSPPGCRPPGGGPLRSRSSGLCVAPSVERALTALRSLVPAWGRESGGSYAVLSGWACLIPPGQTQEQRTMGEVAECPGVCTECTYVCVYTWILVRERKKERLWLCG